MSKIKVLDASLANMIAAGEVVERPSSVVKELMENALDANASEIEIQIYGAGREKIIIRDNGIGMNKEDLQLAFTRHATSKIQTKNDLFNISTLGFRGEALPSIAAVSKVTLQSCQQDSNGWKVKVENAKIINLEPSDGRKGTTVIVEDLFYNTPARLKHLKYDSTEISHISDIVTKLALGYPNVKIKLEVNDKITFQSSGRGNTLEIISNIYGLESARNMIEVNFEDNDFVINGYISKFNYHKASRKYMTFLLNNRSVRIPTLQSVLVEAYKNYIPSDRFPLVVLNIEVDPRLVDVNVHPSKNEVRLSKDESLSKLVRERVREKLEQTKMIPLVNVVKKQEVIRPTLDLDSYEQPAFMKDLNRVEVKVEESPLKEEKVVPQVQPKYELREEVAKYDTEKVDRITPIGQIHGTYIVAENKDGFYLIDQHAAMERINFEKYSKEIQEEMVYNDLLIPKVIELNFSDIQIMKDKLYLLEEVGIKSEIFGSTALRVNAVPLWMNNLNLDYYISEMIEQILRHNNVNILSLRNHAVATMACKASLKANKALTLEEQQELIDRLMKCSNPHSCPHGRPTTIFYSKYELEKLFKRVG